MGASSDNFEGYVIYRSTELDGTYASVATTSGTAYVDTGLESKPYYYYIKAKDNTNNLSVASSIVTIIPTGRYTTAPTLIQKPTVKTQSFIATFNWGTSRVASSFVEYGKSISLGETNGQVDSVTDHEVIINGLSADTKYFYKVKYIDPDGNIGTSEIGNFTTLPPPVVSEFAVTEIKLDSALISWKTNTSATCILKYGAGSLSNTIEETDGASAHIQKVVGLVAETDYQAQVDCVDGDLNDFNSDQYNFATPIKPIATDITVQNVENVDLPTILIEYKTNIKATTHLYYKSSEESTPHTYLTEEKTIEHKAEIRGLDPAKEYVLTIIGTDENGITLEPVEQKITTKSDSRPPEITINRAVGKVLGRGASSQANLYVKIETNEPTKLKIKYTKGASVSGFDQSTGEDPLNTYHLMTIPAEVGQMYSYQAEVFDEAGNLTNSKVSTIIVEDAKSSASEIIIGTTTKQFGWLSEIWNK
ncbi:MAG: PKD protein [uncultured bacterium]|nr:MAG: PKD protein [uncultured bacterium]